MLNVCITTLENKRTNLANFPAVNLIPALPTYPSQAKVQHYINLKAHYRSISRAWLRLVMPLIQKTFVYFGLWSSLPRQ